MATLRENKEAEIIHAFNRTFFTLLSPLVSQPVIWRDFALLRTHGANCCNTLLNYKVFDNNLITYL